MNVEENQIRKVDYNLLYIIVYAIYDLINHIIF